MDLETLLSFDWGIMIPEFIILGVAAILTLWIYLCRKTMIEKSLAGLGSRGFLPHLFHCWACWTMGWPLFYTIRFA